MSTSEQSALSVELAKCLKLVAPASMAADAQMSWIASAMDALEDIRAPEVAAVSAEIRRTVTRPAQIVPEIARLVAEKRKSARFVSQPQTGMTEYAIDQEAQRRRSAARGRDEIEAAWQWERTARTEAGLAVAPIQPPLTPAELNAMPGHIAALGIAYGFLERRGGALVEVR